MAIEITPAKRDRTHAGKRRRGVSALWRLCGWGGAAALALTALALTVETDIGRERLQAVMASATVPTRVATVAPVPQQAAQKDSDTKALEAQLRTLSADRDQLAARMGSLERLLEDVTGSIARQAAQPPAPPTPPPMPAPTPPPMPAPEAASVAPPPSAPGSRVAMAPAATPLPVIDPLAMPVLADGPSGWPATLESRPEQPEAPELTEPQTAVPLPPARFVAAPAQPPPLPKPEYGIELGSAPNMDLLRSRWTAAKANYGPLLTGLQPIAVRDRRPGSSEFRLIAGPLPNFAAARQLCARFANAQAACRPAKFDADKVVQR